MKWYCVLVSPFEAASWKLIPSLSGCRVLWEAQNLTDCHHQYHVFSPNGFVTKSFSCPAHTPYFVWKCGEAVFSFDPSLICGVSIFERIFLTNSCNLSNFLIWVSYNACVPWCQTFVDWEFSTLPRIKMKSPQCVTGGTVSFLLLATTNGRRPVEAVRDASASKEPSKGF